MTQAPPARPSQMHGVLVLDKPAGPTSARCLEDVKHRLGQKKIGHCGTLDPLATGVLLVLLGEGTKLAPFLSEGVKVYRGRLRLGQATDTFDAQGQVTAELPWEHILPEAAAQAALSWKDMTSQEIPAYSAVKVKGQPLYKLARQGREIPAITKPVTVFDVEVLSVDLPFMDFRVTVSTGAYVRSLVHSLGTRLGCGAHLTELTREYSHPFGLDQACPLAELLAEPERLAQRVVPLGRCLPHWPRLALTIEQASAVRDGKRLSVEELPGEGPRALLVDSRGLPLALAHIQDLDGALRWAILRGLNLPPDAAGDCA